MSPTPISRRFASMSLQKWSNSACPKRPGRPAFGLQTGQHQNGVQDDHLQPSVGGIRNPVVAVKCRRRGPAPRSRHIGRRWCRSRGVRRNRFNIIGIAQGPRPAREPDRLQRTALPGTSTGLRLQWDMGMFGGKLNLRLGKSASRQTGPRCGCCGRAGARPAPRWLLHRDLPEGLRGPGGCARANPDRRQPGTSPDPDGHPLDGRNRQRRGVLLHLATRRAPGCIPAASGRRPARGRRVLRPATGASSGSRTTACATAASSTTSAAPRRAAARKSIISAACSRRSASRPSRAAAAALTSARPCRSPARARDA